MRVNFAQHEFDLLADRALYWPAERTLFVADTHFGKETLFQSRGVPVPGMITASDLGRLTLLLERVDAHRLIILGDFFHGPESQDELVHDVLHDWRRRHAQVAMTLVRGNHDRRSGDPPASLAIDVVASLSIGTLELLHEPTTLPGRHVIAGHIHPGVRLTDFDGSGVTVPAFVIDEHVSILPAFGRFTGLARVDPAPRRRLFAVAARRVVEVRHPG